MKKILFILFCLAYQGNCILTAQMVTTFAGSGAMGSVNGVGTAASFYTPSGLTVDATGNIFVVDQHNNLVRKITPSGVVTTFAGSGVPLFCTPLDGPGSIARFCTPLGITHDLSGNLYVGEPPTQSIRKITSAGTVSSFAGLFGNFGSVDGIGTAASFYNPGGVAADISGNIYVSDGGNHLIRKITPAGLVSTIAGSGVPGSANGTGTAASFNHPFGIAIDLPGNIYVADTYNHLIRKISPSGVVTTIAGNGTGGSANGIGMAAGFNNPSGIAVDLSGNVYVADEGNHLIRKISSTGLVTTLAGSGLPGSANGIGTSASFKFPFGVAVDAAGNVWVADMGNNLIRKISASCPTCTFSGFLSINGTNTNISCNTHIPISCNEGFDGTITKTCNGIVSSPLQGGVVRQLPSNTYVTTLNDGFYYTFTEAGNYSVTYYNTQNGVDCDSCKIFFDVSCACPSTCTVQPIVTKPAGGGNVTLSNTPTNLECGPGYDFNPAVLTCNPAGTAMIIKQIKVVDAAGNTPSWATTMTGSGMLNIPFGTTGLFYVKYVWGTATTRCDSVLYPLNITCNLCSIFVCSLTSVTINSPGISPIVLSTANNYTTDLLCNKSYQLAPVMSCNYNTNQYFMVKQVNVYDAANVTPVWANTFINSLGILNLSIPNNVTGTFKIKYLWGYDTLLCDSAICTLNITCPSCQPNCTFGGTIYGLTAPGLSTTLQCGATYNVSCNQSCQGGVLLNCTNPSNSTLLTTGSVRNAAGQVVTGLPFSNYNFPNPGVFTYTYYKTDTAGHKCDSCKITFNVTCAPDPCEAGCRPVIGISGLAATTTYPPADATTAINLVCNRIYGFTSSILCDSTNPGIVTKQVKVYDASGITASWAATFINALGTGNLSVPSNVSGTYYIKYIWGTANIACDSATYIFTISCPSPVICDQACYFVGTLKYGAPQTTVNLNCNSNTVINLPCSTQTTGGIQLLCPGTSAVSIPFEARDGSGNIITGITGIDPVFNLPGDYVITYYKLNSINQRCDSCKIRFHIAACTPPVCIPCNAGISGTSGVSIMANTSLGVTQLTQSFSFTGLPATITEIRAVVTNIIISATDDAGNTNGECLSCISNPIAWGSIIKGSYINGTTATINVAGTDQHVPITLQIDQNPRQVIWANNGNVFALNNPLEITFYLPPASMLSCCTRKANICMKFVFRDNNCEECIVYKCFDVEIK